jgi:enoyl-CoA hydratase/carnithine racemase
MMHLMSHDDLSPFELSGEYLALTGARLNAKEMISAGLATHFVSSEVRHFQQLAFLILFVFLH